MATYITFTKKGLFVIFAIFICAIFICYDIGAATKSDKNATTNADRLIFIKNLGYTVNDCNPTVKTVNIPEVFYDVYKNYNNLQKRAKYDLSLYKGCQVKIYTYKINSPKDYTDECVINMIVYNDRVIGGDISSTTLGGFMLPLEKVID